MRWGQFRQFQTFWNGSWSVMVQTPEGRDLLVSIGLPANQIVVLDDLPQGALSQALLVVFEGCRTASPKSPPPAPGNAAISPSHELHWLTSECWLCLLLAIVKRAEQTDRLRVIWVQRQRAMHGGARL